MASDCAIERSPPLETPNEPKRAEPRSEADAPVKLLHEGQARDSNVRLSPGGQKGGVAVDQGSVATPAGFEALLALSVRPD